MCQIACELTIARTFKSLCRMPHTLFPAKGFSSHGIVAASVWHFPSQSQAQVTGHLPNVHLQLHTYIYTQYTQPTTTAGHSARDMLKHLSPDRALVAGHCQSSTGVSNALLNASLKRPANVRYV